LTNQTLFDAADDLGVLEKVRRAPIPPPSRRNPDVPRDLDAVVLTALERDPDRRWQSASAMRTALANVATELATTLTNAQVIEWIEWAFTQKPGEERTNVSQLIQLLEKPSRPGASAASVTTEQLGLRQAAAAKQPAPPAKQKRLVSTPRVGAAMVRRRGSGRRLAMWLVALLVIAAAAAAIYRFGVPSALTRSF
ncbi:MAG TPA: hypothetical protein VFS15_04445, partial [Kofleriaceae bacterium]|nr:hypothetical protein [Kofleriaceae bacterium]